MKTKTRFHKLTAWLLTLAMLMTFIPSFTLGVSAETITSGTSGNINYTIDSDGVMTISGSGKIADYFYQNINGNHRNLVKRIVVENGITSIGKQALDNFYNVTSVSIAQTVTSIGQYTFSNCKKLNTITYWGTRSFTTTNILNSSVTPTIYVKTNYSNTTMFGKTVTKILTDTSKKCTVKFDMNGYGTQVDSQYVFNIDGYNKVTKPTDPSAPEVKFEGWYKDSEFNTAWNFDTDTVSDNTTIYAKWNTTPDHTVSFNMGSYGTVISDRGVVSGSLVAEPEIPTDDDALFLGWYKDSNFETPWDFASDTVTSDITLYAEWRLWYGTAPSTGDGSESSPFEIGTADELYWFADYYNNSGKLSSAYAILVDDITVNQNVLNADGTLNGDSSSFRVWQPIGNSSIRYVGTFDGQGHTISGLYFNNTDSSEGTYVGCIGRLGAGTVKNLEVADSYFKGYQNVGGIVGSGQSNTASYVENCKSSATVYASYQYAGGISGNYSTVKNSLFVGKVGGVKSIGAIYGSYQYAHISNCYYLTNCAQYDNGKVQYGIGTSQTNSNSTDGNNVNYFAVNTTQLASGEIAYKLQGAQEDDSVVVWGQQLTGENSDAYPTLGGPHVVLDTATGTYINSEEGSSHTRVRGYCCDEDYDEPVFVDESNCASLGLTSDYIGYYAISNYGQLYGFAKIVNGGDYEANAVLTDNIVANENVLKADGTLNGDEQSLWQWNPILTDGDVEAPEYADKYEGTFDGNNKYISGLYYNNSVGTVRGLFGYVGENGVVKNLGIVDSYIYGQRAVGAIAGYNFGNIENCYNESTIKAYPKKSTGMMNESGYFGGIVGYNEGGIENCHNDGYISGATAARWIGGICGFVEGGVIDKCYNTGTVDGTARVGGIVGEIYSSSVSNTYNTGDISSTSTSTSTTASVGGIAGVSNGNGVVVPEIKTSYNFGNVSAPAYVGGILGHTLKNPVVTNCYYRKDSAVDANGSVDNSLGNALTLEQMTDDTNWKSNFAGFDTTNVWSKDNNTASAWHLPKLDSNSPSVTPPHTHSWNYTVNGTNDTITASCTADGCPNTDGGSVIIAAPDSFVYTGSAIEAKVTNTLTTGNTVTVVYTPDSALTDGKPQNVGSYTASITIEGKTVSVSYNIVAEITFNANGGACETNTMYTDADGKLNSLPNATHSDATKSFDGWYTAQTGGTKITTDTVFEENTTVYAQFLDHVHNWSYTANDAIITATCTASGCPDTNGGSVTIAAPASRDYTAGAIEAVVTNNLVDTTVDVNVVYTAATGSELTEAKPVKVGTYTASVTIDGATASVEFSIVPAPVVTEIKFNRECPAYDEDSNTFYVSDDFPFYLTVTGEYLEMLENAGGLRTLFFGNTQNAGGTIMGITIESDTHAYGLYNTGSLSYAINNAGGGATYIDSIKVGDKWLYVNLKYATTYELTINESENGTVSHGRVIDNMVAEHTEVILTVTPDNGYELEKLIVDGIDVTTSVTNNNYTFTMPAKAITVSATFKKLPHTHDWKFTANGNVITATCEGTLGVCPNPTSTVTLVAPENLVYNGSEKVVTTSGTIDGVTIPEVQYEGNRANAGTFTASLTIDNTTATLTVTITPKSLSGAVIVLDNNTNLGYTGTAITPAVTSVTLDTATLTADDYTVSYSDNTNAGQATVTVTGKGNYKDTASTNFTITKATPVVTAPTGKTGLIYTSEAQALVNAGSTKGGTMQYSLDNVTYNTDIPTGINAGAYTVYYKVVGNDNYNDVSASSVEVTIGKQTVNKPTANIKEYTGTELTADIPTSELYTVSQAPQTETGEYDVTLTLTDVANYKWADTDEASVTLKFNITTATNSWKTEPSVESWTFGQTASTPSYEAKFGNSNVKVEYKKATEEDSAYTTTVPTNAGDYKVRFSVAATTNYTALSKVVDLTIAKAQAVITVDTTPIEKFYGEALTLPTATTNIGSVTVDKDVDEMKNKGTYTVTYTVTGTSDYDGDTKTVSVTIKQLPVNITWENAEGLVYDGTEKTITAVLSNKVAGDNVNLTVEGTPSATDKGTYTATVTAVDNDNYTITNGTNLTKEWAISETANEWTSALSITGWTFGDNANVPTATAKFGTVEFTYADSEDGAFTDTVPTNTGTYYVKATVAGTSSYAEISNTAQFVIEAKELNENNITAIEDKTYTGEEIKPVLEVKDGDIVLVLDTDYEVAYQSNVNAGTAKVVVTFKGNYKGNAEKEFTILKKLIDSAITLTAPVKNTAPQTEITGDGYAATVVWSPEVTDKFGYNTEYTATITITVDENHTVTGIAANGYTVEGAKAVTNEENSNVVIAAFEKTGSRPSSGGVISSYTVKFEENGGTAIANKSVTRNSKLTEPTAPTKDGFTFEGWYTDKELTAAYDFDTKVTKSFTLYAKWNEIQTEDDNKPGTSGHNCPSLKFSDLDITQWYHLDTDYVIENDIFRGTTESTFTPNGNITRAMMITVLYRAEGEPEVTGKATFEDIDENAYYAKAVVWGQQNGIIKGYSETEYAPEQDILREQIAAIMHRYAQYKGYDVSVGENTNILSYDDFAKISEYAIPSMQWAVGSGMIKGRTESTLNPEAFATRVEIAAMLHRFIEANK